jgi:hypothetical protein
MLDKHQHFRETVYLLLIQSKEIRLSTKKPKAEDVEEVTLKQGRRNGILGVGNRDYNV